MRDTTRALMAHYVDQLNISGDVLEIGGHRLAQCSLDLFREPRFTYHDLNIEASDIPNTIIADITDCRDVIPDESFDFVFSSDVFEHLDRPWLAAKEIGRILKPGGIAVTHTLWSWRNHPCPIDYWRYSPECLEFLFSEMEVLEKGYDLSERRVNQPGFWSSGADSVPVDQFGGWREHWSVYCVTRKGSGPSVNPFKDSDHKLAPYLRASTQGVVTNPKMLGQEPPTAEPVAAIIEMQGSVVGMSQRIELLTAQTETLAEQVRTLSARPAPLQPPAPLHRRLRRRLRKVIRAALD